MSATIQQKERRLASGFLVLSFIVLGLITLGATVRANNAGLSCPDWPLCFGDVIPRFDARIALEWGHRALAGSVTLGFAFLSMVIFRDAKLRERLQVQATFGWMLLLTQIGFGGLTVLLQLAPWTVTVHLLLGNTFCLTLLWIASDLREFTRPPHERGTLSRAVRFLCALCAGTLAFQLLLGGLVSSHYAGLACSSFPTCDGTHYIPTLRGAVGMQVIHRLNGMLLLACFAILAFATRKVPRIGRLAKLALCFVIAQTLIGIANVQWGLPAETTALHTAVATVIVLLTTLLLREVILSPAASPIRRASAGLGVGEAA
jgi:cytochrome c oxidase assembly protein subunit 15